MVCRINNTTRRYYDYLKASAILPANERSIQLPADHYLNNAFDETSPEIPQAWQDVKCPPPIISQAQKVLLHRLKIIDDDTFELDGEPASIKQIVDAVNKYVRQMGGQYLNYPGIRPHHQDGLNMKITGFKENLPCN